jgi:hypothetical protein
MSSMMDAPMPAEMSVREARDRYLAENGFTVKAYEDKFTEGAFLGMKVLIPNTKTHRWAIMLHDLHHAATGYGTDLTGEGEISAWELRRGLRGLGLYVGFLILIGTINGLIVAPRRSLAAWRASGEAKKKNLWSMDVEYETLLAMNVGELRAFLGVPERGVATFPRGLHSRAPHTVEAIG